MRSLEQPLIQLRGFRNSRESGKIIGFQVPVRLCYYRGVWVSQLRPATVEVDGVTYQNDQLYWTIDGKIIEQSDLASNMELHWNSRDVAFLTVRKEGGLEPGIHDVKVAYDYSASYLPPAIDTGYFPSKGERRMVLVK